MLIRRVAMRFCGVLMILCHFRIDWTWPPEYTGLYDVLRSLPKKKGKSALFVSACPIRREL